jgi:Domain of unknown function (DUF1707)
MTQPGHGHLRTSSADRERAIDVLKAAFAEGRLDQEEYLARAGRAESARTYADLAVLTADLPVGPLGTLLPQAYQPGFPDGGPPAPPAGYRAADKRDRGSQLPAAALLLGMTTWIYPLSPFTLLPALLLGTFALVRTGPADGHDRVLATVAILLAVFGAFSHFAL